MVPSDLAVQATQKLIEWRSGGDSGSSSTADFVSTFDRMPSEPTQNPETEVPIDVASAFTPFNEAEREQLRLFSQHVADVNRRQLAQRQKFTLTLTGPWPKMEDVDEDKVIALVSSYRKLAVLQDDRGNFDRIRKLLGRHAHQAGTEAAARIQGWLKYVKDLRKKARQAGQLMGYRVNDEDLRPDQIIDWLVNGVVAHSFPGPRQRWDQLGGWENGALLMKALDTMSDEIRIFRAVDELVQEILASPGLQA